MFPSWDFTQLYELHQQSRDIDSSDVLQTKLRYFVEFHTQIIHQRHLAYARLQAFDPGFIALYEDAVAWALTLCEPGGEKAYAEHLTYLTRPDEPSQRLAVSLKGLAASLDHPIALYDLALIDIENERGFVRRVGVFRLWIAANTGYLPAQEELADVYAEGLAVSRDPARAYYWYVRAQRNGASVFDRVQNLAADMLPEARAKADAWLLGSEVPSAR